MTTVLYRPVPIETAEQLEALPDGTILRGWTAGRYTRVVGYIDQGPSGNRAVVGVDEWPARRVLDHGFAALVPVEAEEQWQASWPADDAHQRCRDEPTARLWAEKQGAVVMSRLVTPWERMEP